MALARKQSGSKRQHAGRVTLTACAMLDDDRPCQPLNRVWLLDADGKVTRKWGACTCGRRFGSRDVSLKLPEAAQAFLEASDPSPQLPTLDAAGVAEAVAGVRPVDATHEWAGVGVVPVGTEVLHRPTAYVDLAAPALADLAERLLHTQEAAHGIGLAANQVGAGVRALAHNLPKIAPTVLYNPTILASSGEWTYEEGCLSLEVEGSWTDVRRPKVVLVHAWLGDGSQVVAEADELFARVLQHELDHLDGVEYVQRLTGRDAERVYALMERVGIDTSWLPALPYPA